jgi:Flp pilus assembly protein TadG
MTVLKRLLRSNDAASAAEFAIVLPILLLFIFGIIDGGRFLWEFNHAEKATQMGVRYAVVTDPVLSGLYSYSFSTNANDLISAGTAVPTANFTSAACTSAACTCTSSTGGFCGTTSLDSDAFNNIVARMALIYPTITASNVEVDYKNVGLGFAGNPDGPDVSPLVTVKLKNLTFHPITCLVFACSISMPSFSSALTLEDASGSVSN